MLYIACDSGVPNPQDRRAARSQVMKDYLRRKREGNQEIGRDKTSSSRADASDRKPARKLVPLRPAAGDRDKKRDPGLDACAIERHDNATSQRSSAASAPKGATSQASEVKDNHGRKTEDIAEQHVNRSTTLSAQDADNNDTIIISSPSKINSSNMLREQLQAAFIVSYYADSVICANNKFIDTFHWLAPRGAAMDTSRNALMLIHLGTHLEDTTLLNEGRIAYGQAIALIRRVIGKPNAALDDCILGACYTLAHCAIYQAISEATSGWQSHLQGLYYLLESRGPHSIESPFSKAVFHNIRQIAAMDQLLKRTSTFLSSSAWLADGAVCGQPALEVTNVAFRLSQAIANLDHLTASTIEPNEDDIAGLSHLLIQLEDDLYQWLSDQSLSLDCSPYQTVRLSAFPDFAVHCGNSGALLRHVHKFKSLQVATTSCYIWMLLLILQMAILDLASLKQSSDIESTSAFFNRAALAKEANDTAYHLCRSLAFLSSPQHRVAGILACSGPLYWAETWFTRQKNGRMQSLCQGIRTSLEQDHRTPLNLQKPVFTWWMLPSLFD